MKVSDQGGGNFELPEATTCAGRCIRVVDVGTHESEYQGKKKVQRKVVLTWELDQMMEDGRPFVVNQEYTASISERAKLGKVLELWRKKPFTEAERKGFDLHTILGVPCLMSIEHREYKGKTYANVGSKGEAIMPLPNSMTCPDQHNESFAFDIEEIENVEKLKQLWGLEKFKIEKSLEWKEAGLTMPESEKKASETQEEEKPFDADDEIPF